MDQVSVTAASGLQSRMEALDMVANNLANTTTGGFKLDREFYSLFTAAENEGDEASTKLPLIQKQWTDFSQGVLTPTGNSLDLALSGKGFFAVNGPHGPLYTRNGSFQLSPSGQLTTSDGYAVRDINGQPIQTQSQDPLEITPDGSITQSGQAIGQLQVVDFKDRSVLQKMGNSYFSARRSQDLTHCCRRCRGAARQDREFERGAGRVRGAPGGADAAIRNAAKGHHHYD